MSADNLCGHGQPSTTNSFYHWMSSTHTKTDIFHTSLHFCTLMKSKPYLEALKGLQLLHSLTRLHFCKCLLWIGEKCHTIAWSSWLTIWFSFKTVEKICSDCLSNKCNSETFLCKQQDINTNVSTYSRPKQDQDENVSRLRQKLCGVETKSRRRSDSI